MLRRFESSRPHSFSAFRPPALSPPGPIGEPQPEKARPGRAQSGRAQPSRVVPPRGGAAGSSRPSPASGPPGSRARFADPGFSVDAPTLSGFSTRLSAEERGLPAPVFRASGGVTTLLREESQGVSVTSSRSRLRLSLTSRSPVSTSSGPRRTGPGSSWRQPPPRALAAHAGERRRERSRGRGELVRDRGGRAAEAATVC